MTEFLHNSVFSPPLLHSRVTLQRWTFNLFCKTEPVCPFPRVTLSLLWSEEDITANFQLSNQIDVHFSLSRSPCVCRSTQTLGSIRGCGVNPSLLCWIYLVGQSVDPLREQSLLMFLLSLAVRVPNTENYNLTDHNLRPALWLWGCRHSRPLWAKVNWPFSFVQTIASPTDEWNLNFSRSTIIE